MNELDHQILQMEEHHPGNGASKEGLVVGVLGLTLTRYYQHLFRLLEIPEVVAMYPQMAKRVLASRERLAEERAQRTIS